jgi:signal transduction histidine kinase
MPGPVDVSARIQFNGRVDTGDADVGHARSDTAESRQREAQLLEAQRIAGIGSWEWAVGSNEVTWSEGLHLILGRDMSLGAPSFEALSQSYAPESWERLGVAINAAIERGESYELELAMIREDGRLCWTSTRGEAVRGPDGAVERLRGTVLDINERKRAEEAALLREVQLQEAERIAGVGSWEWAVGGEDITWSEGLHLILGRDVELGPPTFSNLSEWYVPESWQRLGVAIAETIEHGTPYELELGMVRADGEVCLTTTRGEAVRGPDGAVVRLRGTVLDITERKRLEARTAQADRLSSMGLLAAGVAHEINNPLTYVLFNAEGLTEELPAILEAARRSVACLRAEVGDEVASSLLGDDASLLVPANLREVLERAQEVVDGGERIKTLVRSLGTFSRVEKVEESNVDLALAIDSATNMARNEMKYRAQLVLELGDVPKVWASEGRLSQVFLNLLINAAHAIEEGDAERNVIKIRTWTEEGDVFAAISDTGAGISDADQERIFEPFWSTKQVGRGSGLGLAICKNIVTAFGGDIWVESELGKGSCFTVRLPTRSSSAPDADDGVRVGAAQANGRVLIVDDEPAIRRMLSRSLGRTHVVVAAGSGLEAREILKRDLEFDVILCDLMMPKMTGMELHEWLAAQHPEIGRRLVFITGGIFTPRASSYLASVDNLQVAKPFAAKAIRKLVAGLVDDRRRTTSR